MGKFKQWIARLFNIRAEDLSETPDASISSQQVIGVVKEEISRQLPEQVERAIQSVVLPEIRKIILDISESKIEQVSSVSDISEELAHIGEEKKHTVEIIAPGPEVFVQALSEEELPVIDETQALPPDLSTDQVAGLELVEEADEVQSLEPLKIEPVKEERIVQLHSISEKEVRIGIDFGTTTTAVSIKVDDELPEALPIGDHGFARYIPSIVYFKPGTGSLEERASVGEDAESFGDPSLVIRSVKRCFGCKGSDCQSNLIKDQSLPTYPNAWCNGDGKIKISETESVDPVQVATIIVREALKRAIKVARDRRQIDLTEENVKFLPLNLGCGANFDLQRREIIRSIAEELGFRDVNIDNVIEEPILAGFTFSRFAEDPEGRVLIYDFGGGTFDVAVLDVDRVQEGLRVTVLSTAGENWLGGDDLDNLVYREFLKQVAHEHHITDGEAENQLDNTERSRLLGRARRAKELLSSNNEFSDALFTQSLGPINLDLRRDQFEQILETSGLVKKSLDAVERACRLAYAFENAQEGNSVDYSAVIRYQLEDAAPIFERVILVGGVTKIPYIRNKLKEIFGASKIVEEKIIEPISAVAIGGAYPREPQHYSISVQPYEVSIEYKTNSKLGLHKKVIFWPYEHLDFHKYYTSNWDSLYFKDFDVEEDYQNVSLICKKAGVAEPCWKAKLDRFAAGLWRFATSLDGDIFVNQQREARRYVQSYPVIHPIQSKIREKRDQRIRQDIEKSAKKLGSYEDQVKGMMNEN